VFDHQPETAAPGAPASEQGKHAALYLYLASHEGGGEIEHPPPSHVAIQGHCVVHVAGIRHDAIVNGVGMMWARVTGQSENALLRMPFKAA